MRIITWNCNMVLRKKAEFILPLAPDILIVPECENPERLIFKQGIHIGMNVGVNFLNLNF